MITITIAPVTPAQVAAVTKLLQDYPVSTPLQETPSLSPPPKTTPRASSAKASPAPAQAEAPPKVEEPSETITLETVRAKLTDISQAGKKTEVAALIAEFGAAQLTKVKPEDYAALMAKAEAL
jgi:hypothetical protein